MCKIQQKIASFSRKRHTHPFTHWVPVGIPFPKLGRLGEGVPQVSNKGNVTRPHVPSTGPLNLREVFLYTHPGNSLCKIV